MSLILPALRGIPGSVVAFSSATALIAPSGLWNGTAGSGGTEPNSGLPTGTAITNRPEIGNMHGTVAPNAQWLMPAVSGQMFTSDYTVVLSAWAASALGIVGGIDSVDFWYEGTTVNVDTLSLHDLNGWDGDTPQAIGYAVTLDFSAHATDGQTQLYATLNPSLPGIASRVVGPMVFFRQSNYDLTIDFGTGLPTVAGVSYPTVQAALSYLNSNGATNKQYLLRCMADTHIDPSVLAFTNSITNTGPWTGQTTIDANGFNLTAGNAGAFSVNFRPQFNGLVWKGLVIDVANFTTIVGETTGGFRMQQFENCEIYSSNGAGELCGTVGLTAKTPRGTTPISVANAMVGCYLHDFCPGAGMGHYITLGCRVEDISADAMTASATPILSYGNTYRRVSGAAFRNRLPAISLAYGGAGTPTFSIGGTHVSSSRYLSLLINGVEVHRVTASTTIGSGNFSCQDAVDNINAALGGSGWTATLLNNDRRFSSIGTAGTALIYDVATAQALSTQITTAFDIHCDGTQLINLGNHENHLIFNNFYTDCEAQIIFPGMGRVDGSGGIAYNCLFGNIAGESLAVGYLEDIAVTASQITGEHHHTIIVNTLLPNQRWYLRAVGPTCDMDEYSRFMNNVATYFDQVDTGGTWEFMAAGNLAFQNHAVTAINGPNATAPVVAGSAILNYPAVSGTPFDNDDFIPAIGQSVRANVFTTQVPYDIFGTERDATSPPGAAV